uniref:PDZ domain-containing protein n=1 Tax=Steinernema glaseri TaxID=37863 RepID=A0A1I7Y708_9BILA
MTAETTAKSAKNDPGVEPKKQIPRIPVMEETVIVKKPLGLRIHKTGLVVTMVEPNAAANGKAFVGDNVVSIDNKPVSDFAQLTKVLREPAPTVPVKFHRNSFSYCRHLGTTVERLQLDKDVTKVTNRAIDLFQVTFRIKSTLAVDYASLIGLSVKYDARERVTVASVDPGSVSAIHLRPGDVIRDVNDNPIASKTMLLYHIMESMWEDGTARLTIESAAGGDDAYRDQIEMSQDVLDIAAKQIQQFKALTAKPKPICSKEKATKARVSISRTERVEVEIDADHDPTKLKSCKNAKN